MTSSALHHHWHNHVVTYCARRRDLTTFCFSQVGTHVVGSRETTHRKAKKRKKKIVRQQAAVTKLHMNIRSNKEKESFVSVVCCLDRQCRHYMSLLGTRIFRFL